MTYRQHLEQAKSFGHKWADAAIENAKEQKTIDYETDLQEIADILAASFTWNKTPQGVEYWGLIYESLYSEN